MLEIEMIALLRIDAPKTGRIPRRTYLVRLPGARGYVPSERTNDRASFVITLVERSHYPSILVIIKHIERSSV